MAGKPEEVGSAGTRVNTGDGFSFVQRQLCSRVLGGPCCGFQFCFMGSPGNSSLETSGLTHQLMQPLQTHHTRTQPARAPPHTRSSWSPAHLGLQAAQRSRGRRPGTEAGAGGQGQRPGTEAGDGGRGWRPRLEPRLTKWLGPENSKVPAETWAQTMEYLVAIFNSGDSPSPAPFPPPPAHPQA